MWHFRNSSRDGIIDTYIYLTAASILLALSAAPPGQTLGSQYFLRAFFFLGGPRQRRLAIYYSTDVSPCTLKN